MENRSVGIVMIGLPKVGKTTLVNQFCGLPVSEEYQQTEQEHTVNTVLTINKVGYRFTFNDCNGDSFLNARTTNNSMLSKGKIHILVASRSESDSGEFLQGQFRDINDRDGDNSPCYRLVYVTHSDENDDDNVVEKIKSFLPDGIKLFQFNALTQKEDIQSSLTDFLKRAVVEHQELFDGCVVSNTTSNSKSCNESSKKEKKGKKCVML
ncbi:hypothetical protein EHI8A_115930 [Entamoeba histolytica HM-1:IMSS-B]|uniref:G domain-containing protein n=6 Tax=Entamoeba histolytica TaxID=5759 RepID=C4MBF1_ENTH1|nr:hypothetical protein EHI_165770 [Entamoeba histolytica HM-1:IMSS]EMD42878.1 Hypothetical protein EHI5A_146890 [Entamoeba histolytica KU27]EMH76096.1 hypothetical protein EHI8A_115930 [Entamoeba histolytica HM-1:IMSS-B]EMS15762.1 hypothetical protein KM1_189850 [Entamoeba histolytica HM-3:IMSS]ENY62314.1 hypothetical protein EHI7A_108890 [Entamoeba histolytica HM-1:IMSS-A]GAT99307.1 hypothetical protein CL6EHI_165770 [Entamoeba histolytica]|eukprot:XP_654299.2 hypothetical protein EHI_165770 [Entamoeba histolytica HM-1:IMSS]